MRRPTVLAVLLATAFTAAACGHEATLQSSADALGAANLKSIEYTGTGRWYQFGQAASPKTSWPQFEVKSFTATINYETPAARVQMTRIQSITPGRVRPTPTEQRPDQYVSGTAAWNVAPPANSPPDTPAVPTSQPAAVAERTVEIWATPQGFLKAALANNATTTPTDDGGADVTFTADGRTFKGRLNQNDEVVRVQTVIADPVLGDTPAEFRYSDYKDFGGIKFPTIIEREQGGHPVLELTVTDVKANAAADIAVPPQVSNAALPPIEATAERLADGVYYIKGGTHHSVAIDQGDHIVVVEAPQNEPRSLAVIEKVKSTIPKKPIRYLINTHHHFDHSGGLRTYVNEGATIVTHEMNKPYYEEAWKAPRTLTPDLLAKSGKTATFQTFNTNKLDLKGRHPIEVHMIQNSGHNDAFAMVFLPVEGILIEGDAYTPVAAGAPPPAMPNPYAVNLFDNIQRLKLNVRQIAALHGPRLATMADLRAAIQKKG
ncbi:MAG TPA: MBL fold metallo-hydrolase [Vicinamibacterales bacterium]|nr:MBL fold metallo-hydrolase [Vicinamibacterales bacterium]